MEDELRNTIERWQIKAEAFVNENTKAFIVDIKGTYYFCHIIFVGQDYIYVKNFKGPRIENKEQIYWADVVKLEQYREVDV